MADYKKEGRISLFKNQFHVEGADNKPVLDGTLTINGIDYKVSLWRGEGEGSLVLSGSVQVKDGSYSKPPKVDAAPKPSTKPSAPKASPKPQELPANIEDIPF